MTHQCTIANHSNDLVYRAKELSLSTAALNHTYLNVIEKATAEPVAICGDCPVCRKIYNEKLEEYSKRFKASA